MILLIIWLILKIFVFVCVALQVFGSWEKNIQKNQRNQKYRFFWLILKIFVFCLCCLICLWKIREKYSNNQRNQKYWLFWMIFEWLCINWTARWAYTQEVNIFSEILANRRPSALSLADYSRKAEIASNERVGAC